MTFFAEISFSEPYVIVLEPDAENMQFFIIAEGHVYMECSTLSTALLCLFCVYYTYNISYPKYLHSVYVFIQKYVLGLKDSCAVPANVNSLITALRNQ